MLEGMVLGVVMTLWTIWTIIRLKDDYEIREQMKENGHNIK